MQIVLLLILVIAVAAFFGKKDSQYSRVVVGSVFGIFVLFVWQYLQYYADLVHWPDLYRKIAFLLIGIISIALSRLLIVFQRELLVASTCFISFVIVGVVSFSEESSIKNSIAIHTGFFDSPNNESMTGFKPEESTTTYQYPAGGYKMSIPAQWVLRTDKGPLFPYFQEMNQEKVSIEFRPGCFNKQSAVFTELVANLESHPKKSTNSLIHSALITGRHFIPAKSPNMPRTKKQAVSIG